MDVRTRDLAARRMHLAAATTVTIVTTITTAITTLTLYDVTIILAIESAERPGNGGRPRLSADHRGGRGAATKETTGIPRWGHAGDSRVSLVVPGDESRRKRNEAGSRSPSRRLLRRVFLESVHDTWGKRADEYANFSHFSTYFVLHK